MTTTRSASWRPGHIIARSAGLGCLCGMILGVGFLVAIAIVGSIVSARSPVGLLGDIAGAVLIGGTFALMVGGLTGSVLGLLCGIALVIFGPAVRRKRANARLVASAVCLAVTVAAFTSAVALSHRGVTAFLAAVGGMASLVAPAVASRAAFGPPVPSGPRRRRPDDQPTAAS